jgi:hypothetical protein
VFGLGELVGQTDGCYDIINYLYSTSALLVAVAPRNVNKVIKNKKSEKSIRLPKRKAGTLCLLGRALEFQQEDEAKVQYG